jgi:hypothetical protein
MLREMASRIRRAFAARASMLREYAVIDASMRIARREYTVGQAKRCFFHRAVVNGMQCVSIPDRTDADIRHVSWLGGQQWRNVGRRKQ